MKLLRVRLLVVAAIFISAALWAVQNATGDTLFPSTEFQGSVFGGAANGNIDVQPQQSTVYTTTTKTTSTTVAAPQPSASASPTGSPIGGPRNAIKKPSFKTALALSKGSDPTVTTTTTTKRYVTTYHIEHNTGGGGIKFGYFFTRYIGISAESDFLGGNQFCSAVTGDLIFRYPFEFGKKSVTSGYSKDGKDGKTTITGPTWGLAPYILGGGGGQWDGKGVGIGVLGGGVEFRFMEHYGVFVEGRWIIHDNHESYGAETAGLSYNF